MGLTPDAIVLSLSSGSLIVKAIVSLPLGTYNAALALPPMDASVHAGNTDGDVAIE
jgi:hypothetical protein